MIAFQTEWQTRATRFSLRTALSVWFFLFISAPTLAQPEALPFTMTRINDGGSALALDGRLDEEVWDRVPVIDDMRIINPDSLESAPLSTQVRIFYDDDGIYVGAFNEQDPETFVARLSARDQRVPRDALMVSLDASGEGLFGYFLRVNLGGALTDGTILPEKEIGLDWDGSWEGYTEVVEGGWTAEIFVPWSMMALPQSESDGSRQIGVYFQRDVSHRNESWSWPALPDTNPEYLSAFQPFELEGIDPAAQFTFYPYASATRDNLSDDIEYRTGADVYWRPNANTQLSATLSPDFGTVESDDIVVNLGAFETFFSEQRAFFLEGQDVFNATPRAQGGGGPFGPITMLNTRRIGASADFDVPQNVSVDGVERARPTELLGAVKATGQAGEWRYGALMASEDDSVIGGTANDGSDVPIQADGRDFAIGRLLYEDTSRGGRRGIGWMGTRLSHPDGDATVNGVDLHYFSADTRWIFDGQAMHSDTGDKTGQGGVFDLTYRPGQGVQHTVTGLSMDSDFDINDVGFLQRNDHYVLDYRYSRTVSGLDTVRNRTRSMNVINQWNGEGRPVRLGLFFGQNLTFYDNTGLNMNFRYFPPRVDDRLSRGNGTYKIPARYSGSIDWNSDRSRPVTLNIGINSSQEDVGRSNVAYTVGLDWRPSDQIAIGGEIEYRDRDGWLIHQGGDHMASFQANGWFPELDMSYFISARQYFSLRMQWTGIKADEHYHYRINQQQVDELQRIDRPEGDSRDFSVSRMTFQARYRWEIAPLSDLFVVYTRGSNLPGGIDGRFEDLFTESWSDRIADSLVIKLRYRLGG
ncbi:MAG: DUF5916 domain-containing protein [Pseudohongiellaceae bacterium]